MCGESNQEYANDMAQTRYEGPQILLRVIETGYRPVLNHPKMVELVIAQSIRWLGVKCLQFAARIAAGALLRRMFEPIRRGLRRTFSLGEHTSRYKFEEKTAIALMEVILTNGSDFSIF